MASQTLAVLLGGVLLSEQIFAQIQDGDEVFRGKKASNTLDGGKGVDACFDSIPSPVNCEF